jgi:hypothetical protein
LKSKNRNVKPEGLSKIRPDDVLEQAKPNRRVAKIFLRERDPSAKRETPSYAFMLHLTQRLRQSNFNL